MGHPVVSFFIFSYMVSNLRDGPNRPKVVTYWLGRVRDPQRMRVTLSSEHVAFAWLGLEAACALDKGPYIKDVSRVKGGD